MKQIIKYNYSFSKLKIVFILSRDFMYVSITEKMAYDNKFC